MNNEINDKKFKAIMNRIQSKRIELKYSYQDLANKTGLSKSTLQRYETGSIRNIPLDKLEILANALEVSPMWIIGYDDTKSLKPMNNIKNDSITKEEGNHIKNLRKLNDTGRNKVFTYTKDLIDNPKFISENIEETPYLLACHDDNLTKEEKAVMDKRISDFIKNRK
ncbi:MAG: helix-turn-helix domain-containing protein [Clostridium septicum]|uniref:helix-turn-helix domain-containing protein n=1 Tax=Clostridium septicum TaxID=1504 RepID=UPI0025892B06|nr:helix-turn-helix domain-containing protein [Clostridium septicum]MDU1314505.1 helix-turn-helix domain-containing protein [Clostridium septicum]